MSDDGFTEEQRMGIRKLGVQQELRQEGRRDFEILDVQLRKLAARR